jgi:hypothetical protein
MRPRNFAKSHMMVCVLTAAAILTFAAAAAAPAAVITGLGVDTTTRAAWRSTGVAKSSTFDPNGDNAYANDGYYLDGTTAGGSGPQSITSLPSYISAVAPLQNGPTDNAGNRVVDDPTLPIASTVSDLQELRWWYAETVDAGYYDFFTITLTRDANFVLSVILDTDTLGAGAYSPTALKVSGPGGATDTVSGLDVVADTQTDYAFFRIQGGAGDVFTLAAKASNSGYVVVTGLGFESIPEPTTGTVFIGMSMIALGRRRVS